MEVILRLALRDALTSRGDDELGCREDLIDLFDDIRTELPDNLTSFHVLVHLLRFGGAGDDSADVRIFQAPGQGQLRQGGPDLASYAGQLLHFGKAARA